MEPVYIPIENLPGYNIILDRGPLHERAVQHRWWWREDTRQIYTRIDGQQVYLPKLLFPEKIKKGLVLKHKIQYDLVPMTWYDGTPRKTKNGKPEMRSVKKSGFPFIEGRNYLDFRKKNICFQNRATHINRIKKADKARRSVPIESGDLAK